MPTALIVDDEPNARERIRTLLSSHAGIVVIGECADGVEALAAIRQQKPELLLLDIQMPGLDGFGVLAHLRPREVPVTVFITAYDEHALRAFDVGAVDYVLKPIVPDRFDKAIERALTRITAAADRVDVPSLLRSAADASSWMERLVVERRGRVVVVPVSEVRYLESAGNYVRVHAAAETYLMRGTLRMLESRLDPAKFMRVHRTAIVALAEIERVEPGAHGDGTVVLRGGVSLPAARTKARELRTRLA